jgi:hypothetical protein
MRIANPALPAFLRPTIVLSHGRTKEEVEKLEKKIYEKKLLSNIIGLILPLSILFT